MKGGWKYAAAVFIGLLFVTDLTAGNAVPGGRVEFSVPKATVAGDKLVIDAIIDISKLRLGRQHMLMLTPMLRVRETGENHTYIFAPVVIAGKTRYKALQRSIRLGNMNSYEPSEIVLRKNGDYQWVSVSLSAPYAEWMRSAELVFIEEGSQCANCATTYNEHKVANGLHLLPNAAPKDRTGRVSRSVSEFTLAMILPQKEQPKYRSETYSATLHFPLGSHEIIRGFGNNSEYLDAADRLIRNIKNDKNLEFTQLSVVGYASPDGYLDENEPLSKKRAHAFVEYLKYGHNIPQSMISFRWEGEDWEGLRKEVADSYLLEKHDVLNIIDSYPNIGQRKVHLKKLRSGNTERFLRDVYYPPLRRDEYTISYVVRDFDVAEAREIIRTKPHQLSLNEMFLVASTYEPGSPGFDETFLLAASHFPNDPVAAVNAGAIDIKNGNLDFAIYRLAGIETPEAWNNLAIVYVNKGEYVLAEQYFAKAADAGYAAAAKNLTKLKEWLK